MSDTSNPFEAEIQAVKGKMQLLSSASMRYIEAVQEKNANPKHMDALVNEIEQIIKHSDLDVLRVVELNAEIQFTTWLEKNMANLHRTYDAQVRPQITDPNLNS